MQGLELLRPNTTAFCNESKPELMTVCNVSPLCFGFSHMLELIPCKKKLDHS